MRTIMKSATSSKCCAWMLISWSFGHYIWIILAEPGMVTLVELLNPPTKNYIILEFITSGVLLDKIVSTFS